MVVRTLAKHCVIFFRRGYSRVNSWKYRVSGTVCLKKVLRDRNVEMSMMKLCALKGCSDYSLGNIIV